MISIMSGYYLEMGHRAILALLKQKGLLAYTPAIVASLFLWWFLTS